MTVAFDGAGNIIAALLYAPCSAARYSSGTMVGTLGYTSQRADATTGLDDYGARYYDPAAGQFTSADTTLAGGLNCYAYVGGNPETLVDPSGHMAYAPEQTQEEEEAPPPSGFSGSNPEPLIEPLKYLATGIAIGFGAMITGIVGYFGTHDSYDINFIQHRGLVAHPSASPQPTPPAYPGLRNEWTLGQDRHQSDVQNVPSEPEASHETESAPPTDTNGAGTRQGGGLPPRDILNLFRSMPTRPTIKRNNVVAYVAYEIAGQAGIVPAVSGNDIRENFYALPAETLFTALDVPGMGGGDPYPRLTMLSALFWRTSPQRGRMIRRQSVTSTCMLGTPKWASHAGV